MRVPCAGSCCTLHVNPCTLAFLYRRPHHVVSALVVACGRASPRGLLSRVLHSLLCVVPAPSDTYVHTGSVRRCMSCGVRRKPWLPGVWSAGACGSSLECAERGRWCDDTKLNVVLRRHRRLALHRLQRRAAAAGYTRQQGAHASSKQHHPRAHGARCRRLHGHGRAVCGVLRSRLR
jgi:hypothetical protein